MLRIFQVFDSYLFGLMLIAQSAKNIRFEIPLDSSVIFYRRTNIDTFSEKSLHVSSTRRNLNDNVDTSIDTIFCFFFYLSIISCVF